MKVLGYRKWGAPYRVSDERMCAVVEEKEVLRLMHPRGTLLFLDSSLCFHYDSRDCVLPRDQMMYAFVSPCRTDFSELLMTPRVYWTRVPDSRLRRMALTNNSRA